MSRKNCQTIDVAKAAIQKMMPSCFVAILIIDSVRFIARLFFQAPKF
jgi:hypothetical protein